MADDKKNKKFMEKLLAEKGAVTSKKNIHDYVIRSPSPSLNFIFGNGHGLPEGYSMLLYGPPRGGKSIICNAMAGQLHRDDPDAWVVKYNTEFREQGQLDEGQARTWGIDSSRYVAYERNDPELFDHIEQKLPALIQEGMNLKLVIIDSLTQVQGRRGMNAESIMTQQIGDNALTVQEGLKRILPVQRKYGFAVIVTSHIRAQIEAGTKTSATVHTSRTTAVRPATSYGTNHHCEYYLYVAADTTKDGRRDLLENAFEDENLKDIEGNAERTGHKVLVRMMDSSLGPKGRTGAFTFDYNRGIINTHEEVFLLGINRGVIERPNNITYAFGGTEWRGRAAILEALRTDPQLAATIATELRRRDIAGDFRRQDEENETSP